MAKKMVSARVDVGLVEWIEGYAARRGVDRTEVVIAALGLYRERVEAGGVPYEAGPTSRRAVPSVPGVQTARQLLMAQRQERVNRGGS